MNAVPESIIVNSCQYTPVYLIQDPGASQGQSYFITQSNVEEPKPISDNLKSFYENSGNIENSFLNVSSSPKPRILKKQDSSVVGNNLKLASFLLPKNESTNKQQYVNVVNNVILKPNVSMNCSTHTNNVANNTISNPVANTVSASSTSTLNTIPRLNIDSKIVKLKDTTFNGTTLKTVDSRRYNRIEKASPKIKPKEIPPILQGAPSKYTNVQLLKLGETYHSLSQLSNEQMKMVTQALKIFSNPEKIAPEPVYDPVTNAQFIYKVVSPRDLTVVGKNKIVTKEKKQTLEQKIEGLIKKEYATKTEPRKESITKGVLKKDNLLKDVVVKKENFIKVDVMKKDNIVKDVPKKDNILKHEGKKENILKHEVKKENLFKLEVKKDNLLRRNEERLQQRIQRELEKEQEMAESYVETIQPKVTRSGRQVKLPKLSLPEGIPHKPKKRNTYVTCFQCAIEFPSLYRLQKHYEAHPTHIPAKIHSNLFHCLLAIIKSGTDGDRTNIFIQQLEQLIVKLKSLLPCLLKNSGDDGKACTISEDVGRLLGINPGKYHLDIEALSCVKNKDGYCNHQPPPPPNDVKQETNGAQSWITMNDEEILANTEVETEDCARINSVDKWPTVNKRVWKQKKEKSQENAKRMRLASENCDTLIELGMDDLVNLGKPNKSPEEQSPIIEQGAEQQKADFHVVVKVEPSEHTDREICANIVEEEPSGACFDQPVEGPILHTETLDNEKNQRNHAQFHSAHFDIRSSPIKPTSTIFRKFQINPELLAKYEAQIIRSIETVDKDHDSNKEMPCPTVEEVLRTNENVSHSNACVLHNESVLQTGADDLHAENVLETSADILHTNQNVLQIRQDLLHPKENALQNSGDLLHTNHNVIQNSPNVLHSHENVIQESRDILCSNENILQTNTDIMHTNDAMSQDVLQTDNVRNAIAHDDTLQEIFRDEDLSAVKESFILDRELKDWILNRSNDEKSEDGFSRSTSLIEPSLLHVKDDEIKSQLNIGQKVDLPTNDNHDESSVLNFLDTLANDCLSYPGTEIRTNNGDFQLDLFSFHSS